MVKSTDVAQRVVLDVRKVLNIYWVALVVQLSSIGVENEESARRNLREMLFTSPDVEKYISGVVRVVGSTSCYDVHRFRVLLMYKWYYAADLV